MFISGEKYYKKENGQLYIYDFIKQVSNDECLVNYNNEEKRIKLSELEDMIKLNPDGYFELLIVNNIEIDDSDIKDVVVKYYTFDNFEDKICTIISRQNIDDFFSELFNTNPMYSFMGCCVSTNNCPKNISFDSILLHGDIKYKEVIAYYIDSKFDQLYSYIKRPHIYDMELKKFRGFFLDSIKNEPEREVTGLYHDIKSLLRETEILETVRSESGLYKCNYDLGEIYEEYTSNYDRNVLIQIKDYLYIEKAIHANNLDLVKFSKEIVLDKITNDYSILYDLNENLYIALYNIGKNKVNFADLASKENQDVIKAMM